MDFRLTVPMQAIGKERARVFWDNKKKSYRASTPKSTKKQTRDIKLLAQAEMSKNKFKVTKEPVNVYIEFGLAPNPRWTKERRDKAIDKVFFHIDKPDIDNIAKLVLDSLSKVVWRDDSQVFRLSLLKMYSRTPYICIRVLEGQAE